MQSESTFFTMIVHHSCDVITMVTSYLAFQQVRFVRPEQIFVSFVNK